jgi:hypothetical protein
MPALLQTQNHPNTAHYKQQLFTIDKNLTQSVPPVSEREYARDLI